MESGLSNKRPKVLVFGFYGKDNTNLGDLFFKDIFHLLFPDFDFTFTDILTTELLTTHKAMFFGGGSFLDSEVRIEQATFSLSNAQIDHLNSLPVFFLGVGAETKVHHSFRSWLQSAKLVVLRSDVKLDQIKTLNPNVIVAPDLVYSADQMISAWYRRNTKAKSVLILPNAYCLPQYSEPYYKHLAWESFKSEFAQFLDSLIEDNYTLAFFPMCVNKELDDMWAATEIVGKMKHRSKRYLQNGYRYGNLAKTLDETLSLFSEYSAVITQRFHGKIIADLAKVPSLVIQHHDKLKLPGSIPYYGINKDRIKEAFATLSPPTLPLNLHLFAEIKEQVEAIVSENDKMGRSIQEE